MSLLLLASFNPTTPTRAAAVRSAVVSELASLTAAGLDACASKRPRCVKVRHETAGLWWLEVSTDRASTAPSLMVVDGDGGEGPRVVETVTVMLLEVPRAGEYVVCDPLGGRVVRQGFTKGGDPLETELDPNP